MRCESIGTPAKRICEAAHIITVQGQTNPIAQVAIGKTEPSGGKQLTLVLPTNVALTTKSKITVAKAGFAPIELVWQRCMPVGCFASKRRKRRRQCRPAAGFVDTEIECFMKPEVAYAATEVWA